MQWYKFHNTGQAVQHCLRLYMWSDWAFILLYISEAIMTIILLLCSSERRSLLLEFFSFSFLKGCFWALIFFENLITKLFRYEFSVNNMRRNVMISSWWPGSLSVMISPGLKKFNCSTRSYQNPGTRLTITLSWLSLWEVSMETQLVVGHNKRGLQL